MTRLFIPQEWVDAADVEEKVTVSGDQLVVRADGKAYAIESAARFLEVEGGDPDAFSLVGKVKTEPQLRELKADVLRDTAVVDDQVAYRIQPGYAATFSGQGDPVSDAFR